jgi:exopolyphosphatase/guanosine-5'-triphosphate,3'-diphosphate pyrophosphatase
LEAAAMRRVQETLDDYEARIRALAPSRADAVLTSAVRDAANGERFAQAVAERYGLRTHVLDGEHEARLTYRGVTSGRAGPDRDRRTLVIDIGGGSTELVLGAGGRIQFQVSTQAGVVRQSDRHIRVDPPSAEELAAVAKDVRAILQAAVPPRLRAGVALGIAVAGTATSLAAIAQRLDPYDPSRAHGYKLSAAERDAILQQLSAMTLSERQAVPGLQPARAAVIVPGIVILAEAMGLFGLESVEVSEHDILHGAMLAVASGEL